MPALGAPELIIILVIIILIFGVGKLPEVGSALGKGIKEFRKSTEEIDGKKDEPPSTATSSAPAVEPARPAGAIEAPRTAPAAAEAPRPAPATTEAPRPAPAAAEAPRPASDGVRAYTVQSGDTLESIAQRHGVSVEALMQANGYSQRDRVLYAGDSVRIPTASGSA